MRRASAGPIRGKRSRESAGAVSRSSEVRGIDAAEGFEVLERGTRGILARDPPVALDPLEACDSLAESTAAICACSDALAVGGGVSSSRVARRKRTLAPRSVTAERKQSALRSEGVTRERCGSEASRRHPGVAWRIG
jgi:hypothetical protein